MTPALPQYIVVFIVVRNMRARGMQNRTDVWKCVSQIKSLLLCAGTDRVKAARAAPSRPHAYARHVCRLMMHLLWFRKWVLIVRIP
jgi:hypothetical protein